MAPPCAAQPLRVSLAAPLPRRSRAPCAPRAHAARPARAAAASSAAPSFASAAEAEEALLATVGGVKGRGAGASAQQEAAVLAALAALEADGGVASPVDSPLIEGSWRLLYTSKSKFDPTNPLGARVDGSTPGLEGFFRAVFGAPAAAKLADSAAAVASSSPIQRTITSNEAFTVLQFVRLRGPDPTVDQVVRFGDAGELRLIAGASTPAASRRRIDFAFSSGVFDFVKPFRLRFPYPVPFQLLGDEAKGWLDTTYLSERVRISKGNKGTTFVLCRDTAQP